MHRLWAAARPLQQVGLYALLLLLPFSKAAVELSFGLLLIGWCLERLNPATRAATIWRSPHLRWVLLAGCAFLSACAASIAVSGFPALSARGLVSKWLEYLLFMVIVADVCSRPTVVTRALAFVAWSAFGVVGYALIQVAFVLQSKAYAFHPLWYYKRMMGPYENPIDLATYLMVAGFVLLAYALTRRGPVRWRLGALVALIAMCLVETRAVGAWLGAGAGLLTLAVLSPAFRRAGVIALIVASVLGGAALQREGRFSQVMARSDPGVMDRWAMWQAAIEMIRDRPVLGHGLNTFMANYLTYWVGGERQPRYAHNCYLQVAAETGVVGLTAFLWLLGSLFTCLVRGIRRAGEPRRLLLLGMGAGLVAFAVQAGLDTNFYSLRQAALFWVLAGMAVGLSEHAAAPQHHRPGL